MGQVADDAADGIACCLCGMYFRGEKKDTGHEHGHPVACWKCRNRMSKKLRNEYIRSERPTYGG